MTTPKPNRPEAAGRSAIVWMLGAVGGYASLPWMVSAGVQGMSPWLFTTVWYVAYGVLYATVRQVTAVDYERRDSWLVMLADLRAAKRVLIGLLALFQMSWLLFAAAVVLADPSIVTVIFESWPMLFGLITVGSAWQNWMLDKDEPDLNDQQSGVAPMLLMLTVGVVGVGLVVFSDAESLTWSGRAPFGLVLAGVAALAAAAGAATQQAMGVKQQHLTKRDFTAVSTSGNAAAQLLAVPLLFVVAVVVSAGDLQFTTRGLLLSVAAGGAQMVGNWCLHRANHLAREAHGQTAASINSLYYLVPVAALLLLAAFADTDIDRPDLFIAGVAGVVAVNMVLHLDPEGSQQRRGGSGHGYKAAVLALWGAGTVVLFRDDWLPESWQVWSVVEYWGLVGVLATVFTLILAFRQTRLAERRRDMDRLLLSLYQRVAFMGSTGELSAATADTAIKLLAQIDTVSPPAQALRTVGQDQSTAGDTRASTALPSEMGQAYLDLRKLLLQNRDLKTDPQSAERITRVLTDVEILVNLRQQGRDFAELAVLSMFAAVTVVLTLTARPSGDITPFAGWAHDTAAMVIAAAIAFMGFDLIEKRRSVDAPLLRKVSPYAEKIHNQPPGWRLELITYEEHSSQRRLAGLLGAALFIGGVVMLAAKWLMFG